MYKGAFLLTFDFEKFARIAASVYPGGAYSLEDALNVFRYFFTKYEEFTGEPHPPIKASQIARIIQDMPYIFLENREDTYADVESEDYPAIIDKYFKTPFKNCDYRINHFFSGRVRELRFYEELY